MKQKKNKWLVPGIAIALIAVLAVVFFILWNARSGKCREISVDKAQKIVEDTFRDLPKPTAVGAGKILEKSRVTVESVSYGEEKNAILSCHYETSDVGGLFAEKKDALLSDVYSFYMENEEAGKKTNATKIVIRFSQEIGELLDGANVLSGNVTLELFEAENGEFHLYLSDEAVNTCLGGILDANRAVSAVTEVKTETGETVDISNKNTLRTGIRDCIALKNYESSRPEAGSAFRKWASSVADEFYRNFIEKNRWQYLSNGLGTTLLITFSSALIGFLIGGIVAMVRCIFEFTGKLSFLDWLCRLYLTVIRSMPVMVQLLIVYFVILHPLGVDKLPAAIICFGLNSGAYVAEVFRGGILAVDKGQTEAGRSLGFGSLQTMFLFVIPQAFRSVLPALANECIALLKESSVGFYIGVADLTQGGLKIRSITFSNFMPLIAMALIYLVLVLILSRLVKGLERRLGKSDR